MRRSALAIRASIAGVAAAFGVEGAWLGIATVTLCIGAYMIDERAPWFVLGGISLIAFLSLTRRS